MRKTLFFTWIVLFSGFQSLSFTHAENPINQSQPDHQTDEIPEKQQCNPLEGGHRVVF